MAEYVEQNAEEWVNSIRRKIPESSLKPFKPRPTIFRVPDDIRRGNEDAYEPHVVSIGPYHRAKVKSVDEHKWRYVQAILQRNPNKSLEDYLNGIKDLENRARRCYQETTEIQNTDSNGFVEMMFVDGCFIVELFLKRLDDITHEEVTGRQNDIIYSDRLLAGYLKRDLCLLENQLPYFILECIFEIVMSNQVNNSDLFADKFDNFLFFKKILSSDAANPTSVRSPLLASLAITFIPTGVGFKIRSSDVADGEKVSFYHLLHLFRYSFIPHPDIHLKKTPAKSIFQKLKNAFPSTFLHLCSHGSTSPATRKLSPPSIPTATMLQYAGVTFKKAKEPGNSLIIKFDGGVMEIPHLLISKSFNLVIRNFNAFEQCHQGGVVPKYFSIYSYFMDCLINTPKDVEILRQDGIIKHLLGSDEEVAHLFNRIAEGSPVHSNDRYLSDIFEEVTEYYNTRCHIWQADVRRKYCSSPLAFLSFVAATILLLLTVIQTIFSFLSYIRPPS